MFTARCLGCLAEIADRHPGEEVVVVSHGLVLYALSARDRLAALDPAAPAAVTSASSASHDS